MNQIYKSYKCVTQIHSNINVNVLFMPRRLDRNHWCSPHYSSPTLGPTWCSLCARAKDALRDHHSYFDVSLVSLVPSPVVFPFQLMSELVPAEFCAVVINLDD